MGIVGGLFLFFFIGALVMLLWFAIHVLGGDTSETSREQRGVQQYAWEMLSREQAVKELYELHTRKHAQKIWFEKIEPVLRKSKDYPEDWEIRRSVVFVKSKGRCKECHKMCISKYLEPTSSWTLPRRFWKWSVQYRHEILGGHVHHIVPISRGGDHALSNLELLCGECHAAKHPDSKHLLELARIGEASRMRSDYRMYRKHEFGRKASEAEECHLCHETIKAGDMVFKGVSRDWGVCSACFSRCILDPIYAKLGIGKAEESQERGTKAEHKRTRSEG